MSTSTRLRTDSAKSWTVEPLVVCEPSCSNLPRRDVLEIQSQNHEDDVCVTPVMLEARVPQPGFAGLGGLMHQCIVRRPGQVRYSMVAFHFHGIVGSKRDEPEEFPKSSTCFT